MTYFPSFVEKIVFDESRFDLLIQLYENIKNKHVRNTIKCLKHEIINEYSTRSKIETSKFLKLELYPICHHSNKYIKTIEGLTQINENILIALFDIHNIGFVHRNIRLPNILFHPSSKKFILNDFEYAGLNDGKFRFKS